MYHHFNSLCTATVAHEIYSAHTKYKKNLASLCSTYKLQANYKVKYENYLLIYWKTITYFCRIFYKSLELNPLHVLDWPLLHQVFVLGQKGELFHVLVLLSRLPCSCMISSTFRWRLKPASQSKSQNATTSTQKHFGSTFSDWTLCT